MFTVCPLHLTKRSSNVYYFCYSRYYISKGAIVDQLGGDLNSTPLHWATRWGKVFWNCVFLWVVCLFFLSLESATDWFMKLLYHCACGMLIYRSFLHIVLFLCSLSDVEEGDCYDRKKSKVKVESIVTLISSYFGGCYFCQSFEAKLHLCRWGLGWFCVKLSLGCYTMCVDFFMMCLKSDLWCRTRSGNDEWLGELKTAFG